MRILTGPEVPTPFGRIKLPDAETPPMRLPTAPSKRDRKVIGHGIGEDLTIVPGFIPFLGSVVADALADTHHAEIKKLLSSSEYSKFAEYNKALPTTPALVRTLCFKEE